MPESVAATVSTTASRARDVRAPQPAARSAARSAARRRAEIAPWRPDASLRTASRHRGPRITAMSSSRIFLRSVLRLRPSRAAALSWLPRVAASALRIRGRSTSRTIRPCRPAAGRRPSRELEDRLQMARDRVAEAASSPGSPDAAGPRRRLAQLGVDHLRPDRLLRVEHGQAPHQVLELAHVARPAHGS